MAGPSGFGTSGAEPPATSTHSTCLDNNDVSSEISGEEFQHKESTSGQMYNHEFVIDKIIDRIFENGMYTFCVRWCGYTYGDDTGVPMKQLSQSHVTRYFRIKNLKLPLRRALRKALSE